MAKEAGNIFIADAVFGAAIGFLAGALASGLGWDFFAVVVCASAGFVICRAPWIIAVFALGGLIFGASYYYLYEEVHDAAIKLPTGKSAAFSAIVVSGPEDAASGKGVLMSVDLQKPYAGALMVFAKTGGGYRYGDAVEITGEIDDGIVFSKTIKLIAHDRGFWLQAWLLDFKAALEARFGVFLSPDEAALLGGETLGGTDGMSAALKTEMSASGTSYIVSMYGYKIAMMAFVLESALAGWVARRLRFAVTVAAVLLFVIMSGGNISAIRAAIMTMLALAAGVSGRIFDPRNALVLTATGMSLLDPTLPTQAAFALSFLSVAGIMYLARPLENILSRIVVLPRGATDFLGWREAVILAVASLLPIIPIIASAFGDFSLAAFPSNILISIGILPALLCAAALIVVHVIPNPFGAPIAFIIAKFTSVILGYQFAVIKIFAAINVPLPFAFDSIWAFAIYYAALGFFIWKFQ